MVVWGIFPSSPRRGGCAIKKTSQSILSSRRRGGVQPQQNSVEFDHHPVRSIKEASRYFLTSRPPLLGEEGKIADLCVWATTPRGRGTAEAKATEARRAERLIRIILRP